MLSSPSLRLAALLLFLAALAGCAPLSTAPPATTAPAAPTQAPPPPVDAALRAATQAEVPAVLKTLEGLVAIESGSRDLEGLGKLADVLAERLRSAGMQVEQRATKAPDFHPQLKGAPLGRMVYATRSGSVRW